LFLNDKALTSAFQGKIICVWVEHCKRRFMQMYWGLCFAVGSQHTIWPISFLKFKISLIGWCLLLNVCVQCDNADFYMHLELGECSF